MFSLGGGEFIQFLLSFVPFMKIKCDQKTTNGDRELAMEFMFVCV